MFLKFFTSELLSNLLETAVLLIVMAIVYLVTYYFFGRKLESEKSRSRFRVRLVYITSIIFLCFFIKIWVTGFSHIFTGLSLVSAGLVVTNKETIMNFVGSMIIKWRGLFSEGDYIQIDKYSGFVHELGLMYFKLFEVSDTSIRRSSGRMIKVPNGLVINNTTVNYSLQNNVIEYKQTWIVTPESDIRVAKEIITHEMRSVIFQFYAESERYSRRSMKKNCRRLARLIDFEVHIRSQMHFDKPAGVELLASYYCYPHDKDNLDEAVRVAVLTALQKSEVVKLSFAA